MISCSQSICLCNSNIIFATFRLWANNSFVKCVPGQGIGHIIMKYGIDFISYTFIYQVWQNMYVWGWLLKSRSTQLCHTTCMTYDWIKIIIALPHAVSPRVNREIISLRRHAFLWQFLSGKWYRLVLQAKLAAKINGAYNVGRVAVAYGLMTVFTIGFIPQCLCCLCACVCVSAAGCGPLTRYVKLWFSHAPGMPGTFSPPPWVSDPDMHHGTCVTHVPWCMLGSLTNGFRWSRWRGKRSRHSQRMRNPQIYVSGKRSIATTWCNQSDHFITIWHRQ